jgi:hypothetical protein
LPPQRPDRRLQRLDFGLAPRLDLLDLGVELLDLRLLGYLAGSAR